MGKINIYIKLADGALEYRDSESQHGKTITTSVDPGDTIIWKLDKCSGISEIKNIQISGASGFFSEGPVKKDFAEWKADVSKKASGQVSYEITYEACINTETKTSTTFTTLLSSTKPPIIIIK